MNNHFVRVVLLLAVAICDLASAPTHHSATIPAGAVVRVRTVDSIDTATARPGNRFSGTLADPLLNSAGHILIPRGAPVQLAAVMVTKSSRIHGRDKIDLKADLITFNGKNYPIVTTTYESKGGGKGSRTLRRTGVGAGAGAIIGGIAGGGTGAAIGGLVGGGAGTAVAAATGGNHLTIPTESVLSFQLRSPLRMK